MTKQFFSISTLALALSFAQTNAATVGHWQFEGASTSTAGANNDWLDDYSGNGHDLTVGGGDTAQASIPLSGNGSDFPNPVPQTAASNSKMVTNSTGYLTAADNAVWTDPTFTVETLFNISSDSSTNDGFLISHFAASGNQRSWAIYLETTGNEIKFLFSANGSSSELVNSGFTYSLNTDYYLGISVDAADTSAAGLTFFLQDLTNAGSLQTASVTHTTTSFKNASTSLSFWAQGSGSSTGFIQGVMDEARFSDTRLSQSELLISVPEPGTYALLTGLTGLVWVMIRRRR